MQRHDFYKIKSAHVSVIWWSIWLCIEERIALSLNFTHVCYRFPIWYKWIVYETWTFTYTTCYNHVTIYADLCTICIHGIDSILMSRKILLKEDVTICDLDKIQNRDLNVRRKLFMQDKTIFMILVSAITHSNCIFILIFY